MANQWEVMSEFCREQRPLLCEEASEEELYIPRYYRRGRPMGYRGRAKNSLQGAVAVLARWPEHWSSFLTYWWIGIGMISLTTFIIYNSLFAFSMIPAGIMAPVGPIVSNENKIIPGMTSSLPEVYMHVFLEQNQDLDMNLYMPHVETIASTYVDFKFNFIILINDTNMGWISAEKNNELALNMLWTTDENTFKKIFHNHNVNIKHVSLSAYMDNSPLRKYWRTLPPQLVEFLARTVSIWDKGGIAFNPDILTPKFQHTLYKNKIEKLLNKYAQPNNIINQEIKFVSTKPKQINFQKYKTPKAPTKKTKLNNIQDIIDALEDDDKSANAFPQQTLAEAENKDTEVIRHVRHVTESVTKDSADVIRKAVNAGNVEIDNMKLYKLTTISGSLESTRGSETSRNRTRMNLLPLFLKYLFYNKGGLKNKLTESTSSNRTRKSVILEPSFNGNSLLTNDNLRGSEKQTDINYKPVIVSAAGIINNTEFVNFPQDSEESFDTNRLTIDLKGNIIATNTACHAFLGTMYTNVSNHGEESIMDFIIAELTVFCKGLLSTCMGINVILL